MDTILKQVIETTLKIYSNKKIAVKNLLYLNDMLKIRVAYQIQAVFYKNQQIFIIIEDDIYKIVSDIDLLKTLLQKKHDKVLQLDQDVAEEIGLDKKQHYFYYAVRVEDKIE